MGSLQFDEKQEFRKKWFWIALLSIITVFVPIAILSAGKANWEVEETGNLIGLGIAGLVILFVLLLMYFCNLNVSIDEYELAYKFSPFHFSRHKIYWDDVAEASVIKYNPLLDFGGWGLRYSFRHGKAYNVWGNMGLRIKLNNGKRITFGTQKPNELAAVIQELYKRKRIKPLN